MIIANRCLFGKNRQEHILVDTVDISLRKDVK